MSMALRPGRREDGVAGPFTGPNATYGARWKGARRRWPIITPPAASKAKRLLVQGDDAVNRSRRWRWPNRLVDEAKVSAVVGHFCSSSTMPASEVYDEKLGS